MRISHLHANAWLNLFHLVLLATYFSENQNNCDVCFRFFMFIDARTPMQRLNAFQMALTQKLYFFSSKI